MMWSSDQSGGTYAVMAIGMIAFWALILWAVLSIRQTDSRSADLTGPARSPEPPTATAQRILADRFARGDIDADDYHQLLADLRPQHLAETSSPPHERR